MSGQVMRVKGDYDVMIHKHHCEDVYELLDLGVGRSHLKGLAPKYPYLISKTRSREQGVGISYFRTLNVTLKSLHHPL